MKIVVLGAGIIGIATAWYLLDEGHEVIVVDRQPDAALETSFANGAQISVSFCEPWANAGAPFKVAKWLLRDDSPLLFRPRLDPNQWRWGLAFLMQCTNAAFERNVEELVQLGRYSHASLKELVARTGIEYDRLERGILHFFSSQADFDAGASGAEIMRRHGVDRRVLNREEVLKVEPALASFGANVYGGTFTPFNSTAAAAGLTGTTLRHNIGCAYWNLQTQKYDPANRRNDTTAADLARIYEGVWNNTLLTNTNNARSEFLESANPGVGASAALQAIINDEAAKQGKSAIAAQFGSLVRTWGKGGSYGTCLPDANGGCGTKVIVRSGTGLIRLPIYSLGRQTYRDYSFGRLISDTPVSCWGCSDDTAYTNAYSTAANELYRDEIREALKTW